MTNTTLAAVEWLVGGIRRQSTVRPIANWAPDGSLWLGTNSAILRFANSSGQTWGGGILHIRNWSGSLSGGGGNQVIFGNSSAGLTPAQVAQIRFDYFPSTQYTAKILPTGEVVPNPSGAAECPQWPVGSWAFQQTKSTWHGRTIPWTKPVSKSSAARTARILCRSRPPRPTRRVIPTVAWLR